MISNRLCFIFRWIFLFTFLILLRILILVSDLLRMRLFLKKIAKGTVQKERKKCITLFIFSLCTKIKLIQIFMDLS